MGKNIFVEKYGNMSQNLCVFFFLLSLSSENLSGGSNQSSVQISTYNIVIQNIVYNSEKMIGT